MSAIVFVTVLSLLFVSCDGFLARPSIISQRLLTVGLTASLSDDNPPQLPREKDPAMEALRGMLLASLVSVQILGGSGLPASAALSISDRAAVRRAELNKLVGDSNAIDKTNVKNAATSIKPEAYQESISKTYENLRTVASPIPASPRTTVEIPEQFKIKSDVQDAVRSSVDVVQGFAKEGVQAAVNAATTAASSPEAKSITTVVQKNLAVVMDQLDATGGSEFISSVGKNAAAVSSLDNIPASVQSNVESIINNLQQTGSSIGSEYIQPRVDAVVSEIQPQINQVISDADEKWKQVRDIRMSQVVRKLAETLTYGAESTAAFLEEQAKNIPPVKFPENMRLLSTTVRGSSSEAVQTTQAVGATWEDVITTVKGIQDGVKLNPGRMQTALDDIESLKTLATSTLADISQIKGPLDLKALAATVDWRTYAGLLGFIIVADAFQKGAFLGNVVEKQAIELMEKRRLLEQAGADSEAVSSLQMESLTLLQEVDLLIKQLAEKSAEVDSLSDTIQTLSAASSTEASRASRLEEELTQMRKELSATLQEMAAASTAAAASAATAAAAKAAQASSTADNASSAASSIATLSSELEAVGQWQRRMSTAVRNAMAAQGRAVPTSELPEAFAKWQASRSDSQSQEVSQQLQSAASKQAQLEQTVVESQKIASNSAAQLAAAEEQLTKAITNSQHLSQQLQASTERFAELEQKNLDAQQTIAQWQRSMSTAVRSAMSAQGLAVPMSELPEAFAKWQALRSDSQSQEISQQLQSAASKQAQLEQTVTESQKAVAIVKEQSLTQLRAAEEQVAKEKAKAEQLSTQLLSSEMKISQLTRSVSDAEMQKYQSASRLRATEEQLASEKKMAAELSRQVKMLSEQQPEVRAAEEQIAKEKAKAEQLSMQLLSSETKISQLTRSVSDAEMQKYQSASRLRAIEVQLASEKKMAAELSRQVKVLSEQQSEVTTTAASNSATQLAAAEQQLSKAMANSQHLSQQLQASTERFAELEQKNLDAQQSIAQWQRRMSTAVRSAMSAQGLAVPMSELPEAFTKWQASRSDSQSQEISQQLQSAASKQAQLEQTVTESQKAVAIVKEQSLTQLRAAEEQVAKEKAKAEQLSTQLLSSEMKISQLTRSVSDAEKATEILKDQSAIRLRATEEQLESEKATTTELSRQVKALSEAATIAADRAKSFSDEMNAKFSAMNTRVELLVKENAELNVKIVALEDKKATNSPPAGAQQIISQLTSQNDDLKLRLLTSDERLFDIQEDMQKKLDSAKSVAKELNARLTEKTVQLESKEGMLMERVKELESTNAATQKTLQETQDMLQTMAAANAAAKSTKTAAIVGERDSALMKRVLKAKATALQTENVSEPPSTISSSASDAATTSSKSSMLSLTPTQIKKKTKKELEDMLAALNISHDPVSGKKVKDLSKPAAVALFEAQLQQLG